MRDLVLVAALLAYMGITFSFPFAGMLVWEWLSIMNPHMMVYSFARGAPLNSIVTGVTVLSWFMSKAKLKLPADRLPKLMLAFVVWMTFNSIFAADPDWSWPLWDRTIKIYIFAFLMMALTNTKARIHATIWVLVISLGYFGAKGGVFTITSGGSNKVFGPDNTIISDNNQLAAAIVMIIPLIAYLAQQSSNKWIRMGLLCTMPLQILTVVGSYSRGGVIALAITLGFFWTRSRRKFLYLLGGIIIIGSVLNFMPPEFFDRMNTVKSAGSDASFMGRVVSWTVCWHYAVDHFPFGAGFAGTQRGAVYHQYFPNEETHAAHSNYFQVLGEHGFPGLFIYLLVAGQAILNTRFVLKNSKNKPEMAWLHDLALMIQVSLIGFYVGGAALSMAYYDGLLLLQVLTSVLRTMVSAPASAWNGELASADQSLPEARKRPQLGGQMRFD